MLRFLPALFAIAQLATAQTNSTTLWIPESQDLPDLKWAEEVPFLDCPMPDNSKPDACMWTQPGDSEEEFYARLNTDQLKSTLEEGGCKIEFKSYNETFIGAWKCRAFSGQIKVEHDFNVQGAKFSTTVELVYKSQEIDNTTDTLDYECRTEMGNPAPIIQWFIEGEANMEYAVEQTNTDSEVISVLKYVPQPEDINKTLNCLVKWGDIKYYTLKSNDLVLNFSDIDIATLVANYELNPPKKISEQDDESDISVTIFGILIGIGFSCGVVAAITTQCYRMRNNKKPDITQDEETGSGTTDEEESNETEKVAADDEQEEKKDDEKEDVNEVTEATEKKPRFSFLTKFFKRDAVADKNVEAPEDMPVKMADCQSVEKEGEEQKTEEFEPETKPEKAPEEAAGDQKSEPTPNTSF